MKTMGPLFSMYQMYIWIASILSALRVCLKICGGTVKLITEDVTMTTSDQTERFP
jgi:hypothetical protein